MPYSDARKQSERDAAYYATHRKEKSERNAKNYAMRREVIKTQQATYRDAHRQEIRSRMVAYSAKRPDERRLCNQRRLARKRGLPSTFDAADWTYALNYFHGVCAYCANPPSFLDRDWILHAEHFIPLSDPNCPGTIKGNMLPACQNCNFSKHNKAPHDWLVSRFGKRKAANIERRIHTFFKEVA